MKKSTRLISLLLALLTLVCVCLSACGSEKKSDADTEKKDDSTVYNVNTAVYSIYFQWYLSYYGSQMQQNYGFDPTKSTQQQTHPYTGQTYYAYIHDQVVSQIERQYLVYQAALAAGVKLTDEQKNQIDQQIAACNANSFEGYNQNANITEADMRAACTMSMYTSVYQQQLSEGVTFTDEGIEAFYEKHRKDYDKFGCYCLTITYKTDETDDSTVEYPTKKEAEKEVEVLKAAKDVDDFKKLLSAYIKQTNSALSDAAIEERVEQCYSDVSTYTDDDYGAWAYDAARKVGDVFSKEDSDNSCINVLIMTKLPYRVEQETYDVRHILFATNLAEDADEATTTAAYEEALKKAETVLESYKKKPTEENFAALAKANTDDTGSSTTGGLYEGVVEGQMVAEFNDWCMDSARKSGDVDIIKTKYGYHLMYFIEGRIPSWKADVKKGMQSAAIEDVVTSMGKKITVSFDDAAYVLLGL